MHGVRPASNPRTLVRSADSRARNRRELFAGRDGKPVAVRPRMLRPSLVLLLLCSVTLAHAGPTPIVGGTLAPHGKWPDTAAVLMRDGACSGTLVAPDVVVTAGHCIDSEPYEVVLDSVDYAGTGERIPVAWSRAYPEWYRSYDIGVVVLARPSQVVPRTITAACTVREELDMHRKVHLVGFGMTRVDEEDVNTQLHEAVVAVTDPTCTLDPGCQPSIAPHGEFIAGGRGTDSCFGDSGGPVYLDLPGGPALVGVVSRGLSVASTPCGGGGIYVRIDKVASWLQRVTGRKLFRTTCGGKGDGDEPGDGGCSAAGGGGLGLAGVVVLASGRRRRRRHAGTVRRPA